MERTNALAELAEELETVYMVANRGCTEETRVGKVVRKAQRIVAELATVEDNMLNTSCTVAMLMRCRAIAEGGES